MDGRHVFRDELKAASHDFDLFQDEVDYDPVGENSYSESAAVGDQ